MATVTWNTSNQSNCNLIFISSLTNNTLSSVPLIPTFPFLFNPVNYGLGQNDIYGTYSFNCQGCLYSRNIQPQFTTTTTSSTSTSTTTTSTTTLTPTTTTSTTTLTPTTTTSTTTVPPCKCFEYNIPLTGFLDTLGSIGYTNCDDVGITIGILPGSTGSFCGLDNDLLQVAIDQAPFTYDKYSSPPYGGVVQISGDCIFTLGTYSCTYSTTSSTTSTSTSTSTTSTTTEEPTTTTTSTTTEEPTTTTTSTTTEEPTTTTTSTTTEEPTTTTTSTTTEEPTTTTTSTTTVPIPTKFTLR